MIDGQIRMIRSARVLGAWLVLAPTALVAVPADPPPITAIAGGAACGQALSAPILSEWRALGGETGRLGCPTDHEADTSASPQGSGGRATTFAGGTVVWHTSGPRAGQAYSVVACYRRYFQFGGPGGWLGLPISDAENTPDGQRQMFEGGALTYNRSLDSCEEEHGAQLANAAPDSAKAKAPLDLFRAPAGDDFESVAAQNATARAVAAQYARVRTEALVFAEPGLDLAPLKLYQTASGSHVTVATLQGERAQGDGTTFYGVQGYVWTRPVVGAVSLKQYRNTATGHEMLVASAAGEADAQAAGYVFERIEGYASPAP